MQAGLFDEQKAGESNDAAGDPIISDSGEQARGYNDDGGHLCGAVDVMAAGPEIGRRDDRHRPGKKHYRRTVQPGIPESATQAANRAKQRERANPANRARGPSACPER
jgi:hypothetical protein